MARSLSETHDATPDLVGEDVRQTVCKLAEMGLVEDVAGVRARLKDLPAVRMRPRLFAAARPF